ncbi:hypothetical protein [Aeromicrobium sp.]|uniref:hypothetical protein n=1 Tax=Aeromicrobium sp. TaxID=1871063 RepID=UPI003D6B99C1
MSTNSDSQPLQSDARLRLGSAIMTLGGVGFVGYGIIFFVRNFSDAFLELGIGSEQVDVGKPQIEQFSPDLLHYISHLHIALSAFIAAAGIAVAALSWYGVRRGQWWAWVTAVVVPVFALAVALPAHYPWGFDTIGHLGLIYADTLLFVAGAVVALVALRGRPG